MSCYIITLCVGAARHAFRAPDEHPFILRVKKTGRIACARSDVINQSQMNLLRNVAALARMMRLAAALSLARMPALARVRTLARMARGPAAAMAFAAARALARVSR
jgi:hypothetical protein